MFTSIKKMSLRTRLALLAGFAIASLLISLVVAWRLARTTETFVLRQADAAVNSAARDLARELQANPDGYQTMDQATPVHGKGGGPKPVPPHVEKIFKAYTNPFERLSAVTLHRYANVEGGIYRPEDGTLVGTTNQSSQLFDRIKIVVLESVNSGQPVTRLDQVGADRFTIAAYPAGGDTTWAIQRLPYSSNVSDWPNLVSLAALGLSIIAVSGLALMTVRDLRSGVTGIEKGLADLTRDLNTKVPTPKTEELSRIALAINGLATNLQANIARQFELEKQLRHNERLSSLGRVVAGVAHEVRNPLSAIKLKVQLAQRSSYDADKLNQTFSVIQTEIERLDNLVSRLLDLGGDKELNLGQVDVGALVNARIALFKDIAINARVAITTNSRTRPLTIEGDANRLSQVVDNVIQNAIDAMSKGGELKITCSSIERDDKSKWVGVTFADSGPGVPASSKENIFEPFHTSRADGTGLGLSIARAIVEEHGGKLTLLNAIARGATFVMELPSTQRRGSDNK